MSHRPTLFLHDNNSAGNGASSSNSAAAAWSSRGLDLASTPGAQRQQESISILLDPKRPSVSVRSSPVDIVSAPPVKQQEAIVETPVPKVAPLTPQPSRTTIIRDNKPRTALRHSVGGIAQQAPKNSKTSVNTAAKMMNHRKPQLPPKPMMHLKNASSTVKHHQQRSPPPKPSEPKPLDSDVDDNKLLKKHPITETSDFFDFANGDRVKRYQEIVGSKEDAEEEDEDEEAEEVEVPGTSQPQHEDEDDEEDEEEEEDDGRTDSNDNEEGDEDDEGRQDEDEDQDQDQDEDVAQAEEYDHGEDAEDEREDGNAEEPQQSTNNAFTGAFMGAGGASAGSTHIHRSKAWTRLELLRKRGLAIPKPYNMIDSDPAEMEMMADSVEMLAQTDDALETCRSMLIGLIGGLEFLNKRFNPPTTKLKWDGWSMNVAANTSKFDSALLRLWDMYARPSEDNHPLVDLIVGVVVSGVMYHFSQVLIQSALEESAEDEEEEEAEEEQAAPAQETDQHQQRGFYYQNPYAAYYGAAAPGMWAPYMAPTAGFNPVASPAIPRSTPMMPQPIVNYQQQMWGHPYAQAAQPRQPEGYQQATYHQTRQPTVVEARQMPPAAEPVENKTEIPQERIDDAIAEMLGATAEESTGEGKKRQGRRKKRSKSKKSKPSISIIED